MADRRLRFPLLWLAFVAIMITGAALLLSPDGSRQALGLALLAFPLVLFGAIGLAYYLRERARQRKPQ